MTATTHIDQGHKTLDGLSRTYGQLNLADANEAETRLKVIDQVLFAVLGWTHDDVSVEQRVTEDKSVTFADYIVRTASTSFLVEAKRAGAAFSLPGNRLRLKLGGALAEGEVGWAIRQARDYCRRASIPFAVVTNGCAWIIFPAVRTDQVSFEESEARVFRDLDDTKARIVEFWELLSRERVLDGNLTQELLGRTEPDKPSRAIRQTLPQPGYRLGRNALYSHIEPAVSEALSDEALLANERALAACYVKTSERLKFDSRLQMHLRDPMPNLGHQPTRVRARKSTRRLEERVFTTQPTGPQRFIVVLGAVGAGKTTFLHYTRKVSAAAAIDGKIIWFLVDFKKTTTLTSPRTFIFRELLQAIDDDHDFMLGDWVQTIRSAYRDQIDALRRGPLYLLSRSDSAAFDRAVSEHVAKEREAIEPYVERILRHAAAKWPAFLIIDNVDQLDDPDLQAKMFVETQAIARRIGFSVIMSLREDTYLRHRDRPEFDAFQFDSFYVDPPSVLPVLSQRFGYAKKVLAGRSVTLTAERGLTIQVPDLSQFFEIVSSSILDDRSGLMIDCLAGGNIRRGLALVREFLASGHTNADRAIAAYLADGEYKFPPHEVLKGAVLGSFKYFNDTVSLLPNLYDAKLGAHALQLLRVQLAHRLVSSADEGLSDGVTLVELSAAMGKLGVAERDLLRVVENLANRGFFKTGDGLPVTSDSTLFPTRLAGFALRQLAGEFCYSEFCAIDTTIFDDDSWQKLRDMTADIEAARNMAERMKLRVRRLELFFEYLFRAEERWIVECKRRGLPQEWSKQVVRDEIWPSVQKSSAAALRSAERRQEHEFPAHPPSKDERTQSTSAETYVGTIASSWPDKDYVFITDASGAEWFSHKNDFFSDVDWHARDRGKPCAFLRGQWQGKPRATAVRLHTPLSRSTR